MLVLSRKETQSIVIGNQIELTVTAIHGGRVKLGITAPRFVSIRRSEVGSSFGWDATPWPAEEPVDVARNQFSLL